MRPLVTSLLVLLLASPAYAQQATETWRVTGLALPAAVVVDTANTRLIVSNMGQLGPDAEADGFLSLVSPDGQMLTREWVTGLRDPKGMAILGDSLFVADLGGLVEVNLADGSVVTTHRLQGAIFPTDVAAAEDGTLYIADFMGHAVFRLQNGQAERWLQHPALSLPSAISTAGEALTIGSFGAQVQDDFTTQVRGSLLEVNAADSSVVPLAGAINIANVSGLASAEDRIVFADAATGTVYSLRQGEAAPLASLGPGLGDIALEGDQLYVTQGTEGALIALAVQ